MNQKVLAISVLNADMRIYIKIDIRKAYQMKDKEPGLSRKDFLKVASYNKKFILSVEKEYGKLLRVTRFCLDNDRSIILMKFESKYYLRFYNANNPEKKRTNALFLSYEAMHAITILYKLITPDNEIEKSDDLLRELLEAYHAKEKEDDTK